MTDNVVRVVLQLNGKQYAAELKTADQQHQAWAGSVVSSTQRAEAAMQRLDATTTRAQAGVAAANEAGTAASVRQAAAFTQASGSMQVSAAQTQAALRMLPAQFTDITTSIASGMPAWQVAIQQGGQIKDSFGGMGAAAKALAGYTMGLINPLTLVAGATLALGVAYYQGSQEGDRFLEATTVTGNAAGVTTGQLQMMAGAVSAIVGSQSQAAAGLAQMATTGEVAARNLEAFTATAVRMERTLGVEVGKTVQTFEELGRKPVEASLKLNDQYRYLTASVFEQIRALQEQGRADAAAELAQTTFSAAMDARTKVLEANLGAIERGWLAVKDAAAKAWNTMLNVGRPDTPLSKLQTAQQELQNRLQRGPTNSTSGVVASWEKGNESLRQQIAYLSETVRMEQRGADAAAEKARLDQAGVEWSRQVHDSRSKALKMEADISTAKERFKAAGKDEVKDARELEQVLASIREKYRETKSSSKQEANPFAAEQEAAKVWAQTMEASARGIADTTAQTLGLNKAQEALVGYLSSPSYETNTEDMRQLALAKLYAWDAAIKETEATKAEAAAAAEASRAMATWYDTRTRETAGLAAQVQARRDEVAALQLSAGAVAELTRAKNEQAAAEKEAYAQALESAALYAGDYVESYRNAAAEARKQAQLLRELGSLEGQKVELEHAKQVSDELVRATEQYTQGLINAAMQGGKSLKEYITGMLRGTAFKIVLTPIMQPLAGMGNMISGAVGLGGGASAPSTVGSIGSGYNLFSGLGGAFGGGVSAGVGGWMGSLGLSGSGTTLAGALDAGITALGAGNIAGGLGTLAGALGPVALGVAALASVLGKGETRQGGTYDLRGGLLHGPSGGEIGGAAELVQGAVAGLNGLFQKLGSAATVMGFQAALESSKNNRGGVYAGGVLSTGQRFGEDGTGSNYAGTLYDKRFGFNMDSAQALAAFRTQLLQTTIQALQAATDIPRSIADQLAGVDAEALTDAQAQSVLSGLQAQIDAVAGLQSALQALPIAGLRDMSFDAAAAMLSAAGGLQNATGAAQAYYNAFYSQEERQANSLRLLTEAMAALGETVPTTAEAFRALVDAAIAAGDAAKAARLMALASDVKGALDARAAEQAASAAPAVGFMGFGPGQVYSSYGGGGGGGGGAAASGAASAADDLAAALKRLGESIGDEVTRLRGLMLDDSGQSRQVLLARFTTATAAARAGDRKALEELPELSRALEAATKASAVSSVEVARMRGWLAGSLSTTLQAREGKGTTTAFATVPAFAAGTNVVPRDMLALIHQGEAIVPKAFNPYLPQPQGGRARAGAGVEDGDLRALRGQLEALTGLSMDASLTGQRLLLRLLRIFENWERGGMPQPRNETWTPA